MAQPGLSQELLRGFGNAAHPLKLYRRAELTNEQDGRPLVEALYVDPLPNNGVLATTLRSNTTFIIGRKGTGKSTIFPRAQHEIRKAKDRISVYLDVKTIFESSAADISPLGETQETAGQ
jgi:hypothetical protein